MPACRDTPRRARETSSYFKRARHCDPGKQKLLEGEGILLGIIWETGGNRGRGEASEKEQLAASRDEKNGQAPQAQPEGDSRKGTLPGKRFTGCTWGWCATRLTPHCHQKARAVLVRPTLQPHAGFSVRQVLTPSAPTSRETPASSPLPSCLRAPHKSHTGKPKSTGGGSCSLLQRIFPTQESHQGLLRCRRILSQLSYQGSPYKPHNLTCKPETERIGKG